MEKEPSFEVMENEKCPVCGKNELTLTEAERDIPFFGKVSIFSMDCNACKYHKADIEALEKHEPARFTLEVTSEDDMKIRVIKSSSATVKIGTIGSIQPGETANGYITNVEGVLNRLKRQIEHLRDSAEDSASAKKAKNYIKKLTRVMWGQDRLKIVIDDPNGNSAILSDKAQKSKLKK